MAFPTLEAKRGNRSTRTALHVCLIAALGLFAYSNTFNVPFQMDDKHFFTSTNPVITDISSYVEPAKAKGHILYDAMKMRYFGYLSFALNYKLGGFDVKGYHIFNVATHILNALILYFLVLLTFRTPGLSKAGLRENSGYVALFSSLLFVSHPLQTEAVTYIFQRLASLEAFFYLLSITFYLKSRLTFEERKKGVWGLRPQRGLGHSPKGSWTPFSFVLYALSLLCAVLAMKTKENAFTLPAAVMLYEFVCFKEPLKRRAMYLAPVLLTMLIIPLSIIGFDRHFSDAVSGIGYGGVHQKEYFYTQLRVIVTYIRLLFLPFNQNLLYDYPVYRSFLTVPVLLSFALLISLLSAGVFLLYRARKNPDAVLIAFGIIWFFLTLSVESSVIPLQMVINEYRVYLPSAGVFTGLAAGAFILVNRVSDRRKRLALITIIYLVPVLLATAAHARNNVWRSEVTLFEDIVKKSPNRADGHFHLGALYEQNGLTDRAMEQYQAAVGLRPDYFDAHASLGNAFMAQKHPDEAIEHYLIAIELEPRYAGTYYNLGNAYGAKGLTDEAIDNYRRAIELKPNFAEAHANLGTAYWFKGMVDKSITHYEKAVALAPGNADIRSNLALAYRKKGQYPPR